MYDDRHLQAWEWCVRDSACKEDKKEYVFFTDMYVIGGILHHSRIRDKEKQRRRTNLKNERRERIG